MSVKLRTEQHLEFLSYTGSSEYTLVKMAHCWKSHAAAHMAFLSLNIVNILAIGVDPDEM